MNEYEEKRVIWGGMGLKKKKGKSIAFIINRMNIFIQSVDREREKDKKVWMEYLLVCCWREIQFLERIKILLLPGNILFDFHSKEYFYFEACRPTNHQLRPQANGNSTKITV